MTDHNEKEQVIHSEMADVINDRFTKYAYMSLEDRALPDARDGLKPSQRRILVTMNDLRLNPNGSTKKSAKICGMTSGDYHPHGEAVIYPTMCRMVQDWVMREPLCFGQGNFGNMDGDPAGAMRYTEAKLSFVGSSLLEDLSENVVPFIPNYNEETTEPTVLPGKFPNLLVNGCAGIAVGWATDMPPHNYGEVAAVIEQYINNPDISEEEIIGIMPGPDFPTGAKLLGQEGVLEYYKTGRGSLLMEGIYTVEKDKKGKESIIISELPYGASPKSLAEDIEKLIEDDKIEEIDDWKDISKEHIKIIIGVTKGANAQLAVNKLLKSTCLRKRFGVNQTVLINGKVADNVGTKQLLKAFVEHRKVVLTNKYNAELASQQSRLHIIEGLANVASKIDETIDIIKDSDNPDAATTSLIKANIVSSPEQAKAVLSITLRQLTKLERNDLLEEQKERLDRVKWLEKILANISEILQLIIQEQRELSQKLSSPRKTQIISSSSDIANEDLIKNEQVVICLTGDGYVKRTPLAEYRIQSRGGKGSNGINKKEEGDNVFEMFESGSKDLIMFFTNHGLMYQKKAYEIPQQQKIGKGMHVSNLLNLKEGETVTNMISLKSTDKTCYLLIVTEQGLIKKTEVSEYTSYVRNSGLTSIKLNENDQVAFVMITDGKKDVCIVTADGNFVRYNENNVKPQGRTTQGSRALRLRENDKVVSVFSLDSSEQPDILVVTSGGYGKRSSADEFRTVQSRNAYGAAVIKKQTLEKNGKIVGACSIKDADSFIVLTNKGKVVRIESSEIRSTARVTQGVRIVKMNDEDCVVKIAKINQEETIENDATENVLQTA